MRASIIGLLATALGVVNSQASADLGGGGGDTTAKTAKTPSDMESGQAGEAMPTYESPDCCENAEFLEEEEKEEEHLYTFQEFMALGSDPANADTVPGGVMTVLRGLTANLSEPLCPEGQSPVPTKNMHKALKANGCGPNGLRLEEPYGLYQCCNSHDTCFSTCGTTHRWCQEEFGACMLKICEEQMATSFDQCETSIDMMSRFTAAVGPGMHHLTQRDQCECVEDHAATAGHKEYLMSFMQEYDPANAEDEKVDALLQKWKGKEGHMYHGFVRQFGHAFVDFREVEPHFLGGHFTDLPGHEITS